MSSLPSITLFSNSKTTSPVKLDTFCGLKPINTGCFDSPTKPIPSAGKDSCEDSDSLKFILSNNESLDSFKKFRDNVLQKIVDSANRPLTPSVKCPSNESEVHKVYRGLPSPTEVLDAADEQQPDKVQHINPLKRLAASPDKETFDQFNKLFMLRYQQLAKGRLSVKPQDLRQYTDMLMQLQKDKKILKAKKKFNMDKLIGA